MVCSQACGVVPVAALKWRTKDQQLRQHGIENIILAGLTAPGCVEGTGRWGLELGYSITLVKDATAAFTKEHMHAATELNGPLYAESVVTTSELIKALPATA